jgi:geranylgeranyl pyrophosphate synthase
VSQNFVFNQWMLSRQSRIEQALDRQLAQPGPISPSSQLLNAMRYSTLNGGKRLRALLVYAAGESLGVGLDLLDSPACAVEMIHAYSLVHDDMPAMDDDDLRRGKPTCHKEYGEATALLTGDALQSLAFEALCDDRFTPRQQIDMVKVLAQRSGALGMAGGQAIDLESVGQQLNLSALQTMHELKTGALIQASVLLGAIACPETPNNVLSALSRYALTIGLAFQVQDDVLDVVANTDTLGKAQGADIALNKPTYPALMGLDAAQQKSSDLIEQSLAILADLPYDTQALNALAQYVVQRQH